MKKHLCLKWVHFYLELGLENFTKLSDISSEVELFFKLIIQCSDTQITAYFTYCLEFFTFPVELSLYTWSALIIGILINDAEYIAL